MAREERDRWVKVIGRFKKTELPELALDLGLEELPLSKTGGNKKEMVASLVDRCLEENIPTSKLMSVELSYFSSHSNSSLWRVFKLEYADSSTATVSDSTSRAFKKKLQLYLGKVFDYEMIQELLFSGVWMCLHIKDKTLSPYTCYVVRYPPSPVLFVAGVRKTHLAPLMEAICLTLDSSSCTAMDITGKDLKSLRSLVLDQHSQGALSSYRLNQVDPNPLLGASRHKAHLPTTATPPDEEDQDETSSRAKKCKLAAEAAFGTNPLPTMENFTLKLCANLPDGSDYVTCKLRFSGPNVFEGIKEAIVEDCFTLPVPEVIAKTTGLASNSVTLDVTED